MTPTPLRPRGGGSPTLRHRRGRRALALVAGLGLLAMAAACGQKPGVYDEEARALPEIIVETGGSPGAGGGSSNADDPASDAGSGADGGTTGGATGDGTTGGGGSGDGGGGGGGDGGGAGEDPGTGAAELSLSGSDRTGVSDDAIRLAVHAPVTGAAPLPSTAFEEARDLYWRYLTEIQGESVLGRSQVVVDFRDDRYTPNTARQACRELAGSAFMLVGGGGTDQIQACGQFAQQAGVPYLSAGVTEEGLVGLDYYFATSMSYRAQGDLLAQYVATNFPDATVGAIITDTPNFDDAVAGWEDAVARHGLDYFRTMRHPKGNNAWITTFARELSGAGVDVLFMLTAPTDYIQFAQQAGSQSYRPQYVGVGISMGLNAVLGSGCPHVDRGIYFSPFPGLDWARENEPEIFQAGNQLGVPVDDLALALWGLAKVQHQAFQRYEQTFGSTDLTREDFIRMLEQQQGIQTGLNPQLSYSPDDHFGASQVHVLRANCGSEEHTTLETFASGF